MITITTDLHIPKIPKRRYRTKGVPLNKFEKRLQTLIIQKEISFQNLENIEDFDAMYDNFLSAIKQAADNTLKKKGQSYTPRINWWSANLSKARSFTKALYRKSKLEIATEEDIRKYKIQRAKYKRQVLEAKHQAWENFCSKTRDPYGKTKKIAFRDFHRNETYSLTSSDISIQTKLNNLEELTIKIFEPSPTPVEQEIIPTTKFKEFTQQEIKSATYAFDKDKAPGIDEVDHYLIRNIYNNHPKIIQDLYNTLLKLNYFPNAWKKGELVFFLKTGKDARDSDSYRPISLLPIYGKILEKMLLKRINFHLQQSTEIQSSQHGFQENKSTETAIQEVFSHIDLHAQANKYISLVSLDISHAFDNLSWPHTIDELKYINLEEIYINMLKSFLSRRGILASWLSTIVHWLNKGCPQGSCLGPFLWRVLLNSLLRLLKSLGYTIIAYADDILLVISANTRAALENKAAEILQIIDNWTQENGLSIAHEKCKVLHLRRPCFLKRPPIFRLKGKSLKAETTMKYLGITLDSTLSFLPHLRNKREEIEQISQQLLRFASAYGGLPKKILKLWYLSILEKKISYAAATWFPKLQKAHGYRFLSSIQNRTLLLISRAYRKTATSALCVLTGIPPLHLKLNKIATEGRVLRLGISTNEYVAHQFQTNISASLVDPSIPYLPTLEDKANIEISIFTDGSKMKGECALAFCAFKEHQTIYKCQQRLQQENSVFQAELLAIKSAVNWAISTIYGSFIIYSDSQSGLKALEDQFSRNLIVSEIISLLQSSSKAIYFEWIRGHSGQEGNELADSLAKEATFSPEVQQIFYPWPMSYLKKHTKQIMLQHWQDLWDLEETGRFTHALVPVISEDLLLPHRNLYIYATNHGPFASYLHKFNKAPSSRCTCGEVSTSLHYTTSCTLTSHYHIKRDNSIPLHSWFSYILTRYDLQHKIIECIRILERNQQFFLQALPDPV